MSCNIAGPGGRGGRRAESGCGDRGTGGTKFNYGTEIIAVVVRCDNAATATVAVVVGVVAVDVWAV